MLTTLLLMRHGRATGQGPTAFLMPEGEDYVRALGRLLRSEGVVPVKTYASPFTRARMTAEIVLSELVDQPQVTHLTELQPDHDAGDALFTLKQHGLPAGNVLVVTHLPLIGLLTEQLTGDDPGFSPGYMAVIELNEKRTSGKLVRFIDAYQVPQG
jgi:phosphohistidine phosphatase